jgi:hypothetical protein
VAAVTKVLADSAPERWLVKRREQRPVLGRIEDVVPAPQRRDRFVGEWGLLVVLALSQDVDRPGLQIEIVPRRAVSPVAVVVAFRQYFSASNPGVADEIREGAVSNRREGVVSVLVNGLVCLFVEETP